LIVDQAEILDNRSFWKLIVLKTRTIKVDELAGIRMFVRVVEGGSFVAAARGLGVSKSVITKRVKELEERLKAQLLVRSTRRLTLTDAGASYFERCVRIVAELDEAQSAVRSLTVGLTGTLRVSCIASFLAHQLCRDVCHFQQQHPDLIVELHHNDRVYDPIQEGYDICVQPSDVGGEGIVRQPIVPLRRLLVAAPDYFEHHGRPNHPDELGAHRCAHNNYILPIADITFAGPNGPVRRLRRHPADLFDRRGTAKRRAIPGVRRFSCRSRHPQRLLSQFAAPAGESADAAQISRRAV
jgi:DNA-binding transcriptional LysR family regulator